MALKVENISKRFGDVNVLRDISFEMAVGQSLSVMGPSGVGEEYLVACAGYAGSAI